MRKNRQPVDFFRRSTTKIAELIVIAGLLAAPVALAQAQAVNGELPNPDLHVTETDLPGTPALPGDTITYRIDITNAGGDAYQAELNDNPDFNTTISSGVTTTPLAIDDGLYGGDPNSPTVVDGGVQPLLLANDFGIPPPLAVSAAARATTLGGSVDINPDGSFTYTPPPAATGGEVDSFTYMVQNGIPAGSPATDTAMASIQLGLPPVAEDDNLSAPQNASTVLNAAADNGNGADNFGIPQGSIDFYGPVGGPLATSPGNNFALSSGNTVNFTGGVGVGTFTYNATINPTFSGSDSFSYQISNAAGSDSAIVIIEVLAPPVAFDDGPDMSSSPGAPFHTALNTSLDSSASATPPLLDNDELGNLAAEATDYGTSASPANESIPGAPTATNNGGTVQVGSDGNFVYMPPSATFTGPDQFGYRIGNASGDSDAAVTVAVGLRPACVNDAYSALGNVQINVPAGSGVMSNDFGDQIGVVNFDAVSANGGAVNVNPNGGFTYTSAPGYEGADTFDYVVGNGFPTGATCTVTITVTDVVWFIDNLAAPGGNGTQLQPFNGFMAFGGSANEAGDVIFVDEGNGSPLNYDIGIALKSSQILVGQGVSLTTVLGNAMIVVPPFSTPLPPMTAKPKISSTAGSGVTLASNNSVFGLEIKDTWQHGITATNLFGNSLIENVVISNAGFGGAFGHGINLSNNATDDGTRDVLTVRNCTFNSQFLTNGINVVADLTANLGVVVDSCVFNMNANAGRSVNADSVGDSTLAMTVKNSTFHDGNVAGGATVDIENSDNSFGFNLITGNVITKAPGDGIRVHAHFSAVANTTVTGNTIDGLGLAAAPPYSSGLSLTQFGRGTNNVKADNNTVNNFNGPPVLVSSGTPTAPGIQNSTITNNSSTSGAAVAEFGIVVEVLNSTNAPMTGNIHCVNIQGNNISGQGLFSGTSDIELFEASDGALNVVQTSAANITALNNFGSAEVTVSGGAPTYSVAPCLTPVLP